MTAETIAPSVAAQLDPISGPREKLYRTRRRLKFAGVRDMSVYAEMFATYWNELLDVRTELLATAQEALTNDALWATDFARDALADVARIDRELTRIDPRR